MVSEFGSSQGGVLWALASGLGVGCMGQDCGSRRLQWGSCSHRG